MTSLFSAGRGSARMLRLPSARGPNSDRPCTQPITPPAASSSAGLAADVGAGLEFQEAGPIAQRRVDRRVPGGPSEIDVRERDARPSRRCRFLHVERRAQRARRRRCDAGCTKISSNQSVFASLPLNVQLSATPPARQSLRVPGRLPRRRDQVEGHLLQRFLDGGGEILVLLRERLARPARRDETEERLEALEMNLVPAVLAQREERAQRRAEAGGIAVRREPHHLVFVEPPVAQRPHRVVVEEAQRLRRPRSVSVGTRRPRR